jgi:4-diphosphocytidyl-2-C-methyl-D-erythritol kinase
MYPVPIYDALELIVAPDKKFGFSTSGIKIPGETNNNLCVKAWKLLQADFNLPEVKIHLHKTIPTGAGLGGGSADAAFMLKLIDQVFALKLSVYKLEDYARQLGSDCAFFINNKAAMAYDKGDQLKIVELDLAGYFLVLVKPDVHISTTEAYAGISPKTPLMPVSKTIQFPIEEWKGRLKNDFETSVFKTHPSLIEIKEKLYQSGAVYTSMSGSGSAFYGLFKVEIDLKATFENCFNWSGWL